MNIIVAVDANGGFSKDGGIPWMIPEDLKYFKNITTNSPNGTMNVVIMGRKTFETLHNKPLNNRINIVLSRSNNIINTNNLYVSQSIDDAIAVVKTLPNVNEIFFIGGESVYKDALNDFEISTIYKTVIHRDYECDIFFPPISEGYAVSVLSNESELYHYEIFKKTN